MKAQAEALPLFVFGLAVKRRDTVFFFQSLTHKLGIIYKVTRGITYCKLNTVSTLNMEYGKQIAVRVLSHSSSKCMRIWKPKYEENQNNPVKLMVSLEGIQGTLNKKCKLNTCKKKFNKLKTVKGNGVLHLLWNQYAPHCAILYRVGGGHCVAPGYSIWLVRCSAPCMRISVSVVWGGRRTEGVNIMQPLLWRIMK